MSLFGRREKKRIAELEKQNRDLRQNLAVAVVPYGMPLRLIVEKGKWYHVSFRFMHDGSPMLTLGDLIVQNARPGSIGEYFDGEAGDTTYQWKGTSE